MGFGNIMYLIILLILPIASCSNKNSRFELYSLETRTQTSLTVTTISKDIYRLDTKTGATWRKAEFGWKYEPQDRRIVDKNWTLRTIHDQLKLNGEDVGIYSDFIKDLNSDPRRLTKVHSALKAHGVVVTGGRKFKRIFRRELNE